jgi:hypothetical protein
MVVKYLTCLVLIGLIGCAHDTLTINATQAQNNPVSENLNSAVKPTVIPTPTPIPESPVKPVGYFTNGGSNGEHQWGFSVELWRQDDKIYGLISGSDDSTLVGNAPPAILEDVMFDPKTQKFSFTAKLPPTIFNGKALPTDVYKFEGILTKMKLVGNQTIIEGFCPDTCIKKKKITLLRSKKGSAVLEESENFGSYQEWKAFVDEILQFRGSK